MKEFKDKVAVVTGAASGIGRGMVENFVKVGMKVVLADIDEVRLHNTVQEIKETGADVMGVVVDVSKADQIENLAQKTLNTFGAVHVLCNNAGVSYHGRYIWEIPIEAWDWVLGINLLGVINGIRTFIPIMIEQDTEACIVNTSSLAGLITNDKSLPYSVSKHGVVVLSEALCIQLNALQSKIKVCVLCPGNINTDILNSIERNRPDFIPPPPDLTEEEAFFRRAYELWIERGLDPKEVGLQVLEAIKEDRFYIITNDYNEAIEQRMVNILNKKNPEAIEPPGDFIEIVEELISQ